MSRCCTVLILPNGCKIVSGHCYCPDCREARANGETEPWQLWLQEHGQQIALEVQKSIRKKHRAEREAPRMLGDPLVRWRYMREGDILEYRDRNDIVKKIGPIAEIEFRPDRDKHPTHKKKYVLVPALREPSKLVGVPLERVQAVFRGEKEIIRFAENEHVESVNCPLCMQRAANIDVPGRIFCSIACQLEWIERYYGDYPPGENPIDKGEQIHFANCTECRKLNRVYCPDCVD